VWAASVVLVVFGVLGLLTAMLLLGAANSDADHGRDVPGALYALIYVQFALSALQVASGVLLWRGVSWAIGLATVICVINIFGNILSLFAGAILQAILGIVINVVIIKNLRSEEVAEWCRVR
jgi:hypothetical protein